MTQAELDRELSELTGESLGEIRRRGFSFVEIAPESLTVVDWDQLQEVDRLRHKPRRRPVRRRRAA